MDSVESNSSTVNIFCIVVLLFLTLSSIFGFDLMKSSPSLLQLI